MLGEVWEWRVGSGVFVRVIAFSGGGWLVGGCGVLECWVAVWMVGVFLLGAVAGGWRGFWGVG